MIRKQGEREILQAWKEISSYLRQSIKTCRRWELEIGMPIHRHEDSPKARVYAYKDELDQWEKDIQKSKKEILIKKKRVRIKFILAVSVLIAIISILLFHFNRKENTFSTPGIPSLAVMYFENHTGDKSLDSWTKALPHSLIHSLMQLKSVRVVSADRLQRPLRKLGIHTVSHTCKKVSINTN